VKRRLRSHAVLVAAIFSALAAPCAFGQTGNVAPTREELTQQPQAVDPRPGRLKVEGDVERAPCPLADLAYKDIRVTLTHATFNNLREVPADALAPLYASLLGPDRPVGVICEIRDIVATELRRQGYLAAVQVPAQQIEKGEVRFEILYARLVAIRVRGDAGRSERLVAAYLERLTREPVFNRKVAERYLLLARDLPGLDVRLALKPAGAPGEVYGDVTVTRTPVEADLNVQNYGARDTGRWGAQLRGQVNGLTGLGDRTTASYYSTSDLREQRVVQLAHGFRLGSEGLQITGRGTYAWSRPGLAGGANLLSALTFFANAEVRYPFVRSQRASLWGAGGFDYVDQNVRFSGAALADDRLRVAYLGVDGDMTDPGENAAPRWRARYSLQLRKGLAIFDASDPSAGGVPASRIDGAATGALVRGTLSGEVNLAPNIDFAGQVRGQYGFDRLLAFEEFSAGSFTVGRGYDPGTLLGEHGLGVSAELRIARLEPIRAPLGLQPYAFADSAWVWNRGTQDAERLTSVGGGVRASYDNRFLLDMTLSVPTRAAGVQTHNASPRLLVSLTTRLWPWRRDR